MSSTTLFNTKLKSCSGSTDKDVGLQPGLSGVQISVDAGCFFLLRNVQIDFWIHPVLPFSGYQGSWPDMSRECG